MAATCHTFLCPTVKMPRKHPLTWALLIVFCWIVLERLWGEGIKKTYNTTPDMF
jgi:hypothetical protein